MLTEPQQAMGGHSRAQDPARVTCLAEWLPPSRCSTWSGGREGGPGTPWTHVNHRGVPGACLGVLRSREAGEHRSRALPAWTRQSFGDHEGKARRSRRRGPWTSHQHQEWSAGAAGGEQALSGGGGRLGLVDTPEGSVWLTSGNQIFRAQGGV